MSSFDKNQTSKQDEGGALLGVGVPLLVSVGEG